MHHCLLSVVSGKVALGGNVGNGGAFVLLSSSTKERKGDGGMVMEVWLRYGMVACRVCL